MHMPIAFRGNSLPTMRTAAILGFPQVKQLSVSLQRIYHFLLCTFFKVRFPLRVERIGYGSDFDMPLDRGIGYG